MAEQIEKKIFPAKVVKVIDPYRIVINRGSEHGIAENQKFMLYAVDEDELRDPDTGESLGQLEIVKGIGKATHVQSKMTTIESSKRETSGSKKIVKTTGGGFTSMLGQHIHEEIINPEDRSVPFNEPEVGDLIKPV